MSLPEIPLAQIVEQLPTRDELRTKLVRNMRERNLIRQLLKLAESAAKTEQPEEPAHA